MGQGDRSAHNYRRKIKLLAKNGELQWGGKKLGANASVSYNSWQGSSWGHGQQSWGHGQQSWGRAQSWGGDWQPYAKRQVGWGADRQGGGKQKKAGKQQKGGKQEQWGKKQKARAERPSSTAKKAKLVKKVRAKKEEGKEARPKAKAKGKVKRKVGRPPPEAADGSDAEERAAAEGLPDLAVSSDEDDVARADFGKLLLAEATRRSGMKAAAKGKEAVEGAAEEEEGSKDAEGAAPPAEGGDYLAPFTPLPDFGDFPDVPLVCQEDDDAQRADLLDDAEPRPGKKAPKKKAKKVTGAAVKERVVEEEGGKEVKAKAKAKKKRPEKGIEKAVEKGRKEKAEKKAEKGVEKGKKKVPKKAEKGLEKGKKKVPKKAEKAASKKVKKKSKAESVPHWLIPKEKKLTKGQKRLLWMKEEEQKRVRRLLAKGKRETFVICPGSLTDRFARTPGLNDSERKLLYTGLSWNWLRTPGKWDHPPPKFPLKADERTHLRHLTDTAWHLREQAARRLRVHDDELEENAAFPACPERVELANRLTARGGLKRRSERHYAEVVQPLLQPSSDHAEMRGAARQRCLECAEACREGLASPQGNAEATWRRLLMRAMSGPREGPMLCLLEALHLAMLARLSPYLDSEAQLGRLGAVAAAVKKSQGSAGGLLLLPLGVFTLWQAMVLTAVALWQGSGVSVLRRGASGTAEVIFRHNAPGQPPAAAPSGTKPAKEPGRSGKKAKRRSAGEPFATPRPKRGAAAKKGAAGKARPAGPASKRRAKV